MIKCKHFIYAYFLLSAFHAIAQSPFEKSIYHTDGLEAWDMVNTSDNGHIISGEVQGTGSGLILIKLDSAYNILWEKKVLDSLVYGITGTKITSTADGGYIVVIEGIDGVAGTADVTFMKTDSFGDPIWCKSIGANQMDLINDVIETTDGSFLLTGYSEQLGGLGQFDVILIKVNQNGELIWTKAFGGMLTDQGNKIIEINDGYFIMGYSNSYFPHQMFVMNTDTSGTVRWFQSLGLLNDRFNDAAIMSNNSLILSGLSYNNLGMSNDTTVFLIKMDFIGNQQWVRTYKVDNSEGGALVKVMSNSDIILCGNYFLMCTDSNGIVKWANNYLDETYQVRAFNITTDSAFLFCSHIIDSITNTNAIYIVKTDSSGNTGCSIPGIAVSDSLISIPSSLVSTNTVLVLDSLKTHFTTIDSVTLLQSFICNGTDIIEFMVKSKFEVSVIPNPFTTGIVIKTVVNYNNPLSIKVYNLIGNEIYSIDKIDKNEFINLSHLNDGIYLIRTINMTQEQINKIVKISK